MDCEYEVSYEEYLKLHDEECEYPSYKYIKVCNHKNGPHMSDGDPYTCWLAKAVRTCPLVIE